MSSHFSRRVRPFFYLLAVDSSIQYRHARVLANDPSQLTSLPEFVSRDDELAFGSCGKNGLRNIISSADDILLWNNDLEDLKEQVLKLELANEARVRPDWGQLFKNRQILPPHVVSFPRYLFHEFG